MAGQSGAGWLPGRQTAEGEGRHCSGRRTPELATAGRWPCAAGIIGVHLALARADRYGAVAEWVALPADKCQGKRLFDLVALTDATTGQPKVAPVAGLLEYMLAMAQGNAQSVPKGGEPAYRDTYSAKVLGKGQGEMMRRHEREFGYGPTAGKPFAFKTIEQKTYAIRWWHARVRAPTQRAANER